MKKLVVLFLCMVPWLSLAQRPVKIIFDTDMDSDVDDVGALSMLHSLASSGEADILAVMVSSLNPWSAPTVDVLNTYFGRPDIPIGNVKRFGVYHPSRYARMLAEEFPQRVGSGEKATEATVLYRQILARQPDNSVVIVTVGDLTNVSRLLASAPDTISALGGEALVAKKVKHLVAMGGRYPVETDARPNGNFKPDPASSRHVANHWPTKIIFTGGGVFANAIPTGKIYFEPSQAKTPMRRAYETFLVGWNRNYHHSADMIAVYVAVRGPEPFFKLQEQGMNHIFENGTTVWRNEPDDRRHALVNEFAEGVDPLVVAKKFDELLIKKAGK